MWRDHGKHNESKAKTLLALYNNKINVQMGREQKSYQCGAGHYEPGMTPHDIYEDTGVTIGTLRRSLPKWCNWGLMIRFPVAEIGQGDAHSRQWKANTGERLAWAYQISDKGEGWLKHYASEHLNVNRFVEEIKNWQIRRKEELKERVCEISRGLSGIADSEPVENNNSADWVIGEEDKENKYGETKI